MTLIELDVQAIAHGGHCVARHEGRVVFVRHAIPGERVLAKVVEAGDSAKFWRADTVEVLQPSPHRVPHVWECANPLTHDPIPGGAEFGHIALAHQRVLKAQVLREQFARLASLDVDPVVEAAPGDDEVNGLGWRTRLQFSVSAEGRLGMYRYRTNTTVPFTSMPLASPEVRATGIFDMDFSGVSRVEIAAPASGSMPVVILTPANLSSILPGHVKERLLDQLEGKAWVSHVSGNSTSPIRKVRAGSRKRAADSMAWQGGLPIEHDTGPGFLTEAVRHRSFSVGASGFWQIHRQAPAVLVDAVLEAADIRPGEQVADLYAGVGLFTAFLAERTGPEGSVLSVESSPITSRNARENLADLPQARAVAGKVERVLASGSEALDVVVLDPPRAGAGRDTVQHIAARSPRKVVYVSCDPASLARDVGFFRQAGYRLEALRAFDLYPHTHHMESLATLVRADA